MADITWSPVVDRPHHLRRCVCVCAGGGGEGGLEVEVGSGGVEYFAPTSNLYCRTVETKEHEEHDIVLKASERSEREQEVPSNTVVV